MSPSSARVPSARRWRWRLRDADLDVVVVDARAAGDTHARRSLARAFARRAPDLRAPRRLDAAGRDAGRGHADRRDRHFAGAAASAPHASRRPSMACPRSAMSSRIARCRPRSTTRCAARAHRRALRCSGRARSTGAAGRCDGRDRRQPDEPLHARLAVVADGAASSVRGVERRAPRLRAGCHRRRRRRSTTPHGGVAYERFTRDGPVALLPEGEHYGAGMDA